MSKPVVIAVAGATASGKSELAMQLAQELNGEIVCMDSMQIYRGMEIGTAKPTAEDRARVRHHMLDIVEPTASYAVADYARDAETVIMEICARGKLPILAGGTGLYLKALMHGLSLGGAGSDEKLREKLNAVALQPDGKRQLHQMLQKVDPASAQKLHPNDVRRVVRALEVFELTGKPISEQTIQHSERPFEIFPLALEVERSELYSRIEKRVFQMMDAGLLDEVRALIESGVTDQMQSMQGIGYKELFPVVCGNVALTDAVQQIILNTRHYAKRQGTWLRTEKQMIWLRQTGNDRLNEAMEQIEGFSKGSKKI